MSGPDTMDYWYGREAQLRMDGGTEFVLTPTEWFALNALMTTSPGTKPTLLMGRPVRVSWETVIPCPHCGRLPSEGKPVQDAGWCSYTPTISQGNTIAKIVQVARYLWTGNRLNCRVALQLTQSGIGGNEIALSKPIAFVPCHDRVGYGYLYDASADLHYPLTVIDDHQSSWRLAHDERQGPTLGVGDILRVEIGPPDHPTHKGDQI